MNIQAVSLEHFRHRRWKRSSTLDFISSESIAPLAALEMPKVMVGLPIGFVQLDSGFMPVAVLGFQSGQNLLVSADGRWLGGYLPAAFRSYPFLLAKTPEGQQVLCVDEDSGLLTEEDSGEAFFNEDGSPSQAVTEIFNFLQQVELAKNASLATCAVLSKHGVIQPWPIKLREGDEEKPVAGLYRIDESALNALPDEAFLELRKAGALTAAYCQLLSMQHLPSLGKLADAHATAAAAVAARENAMQANLPAGQDLNLEFLNNGGTISFGNLI